MAEDDIPNKLRCIDEVDSDASNFKMRNWVGCISLPHQISWIIPSSYRSLHFALLPSNVAHNIFQEYNCISIGSLFICLYLFSFIS